MRDLAKALKESESLYSPPALRDYCEDWGPEVGIPEEGAIAVDLETVRDSDRITQLNWSVAARTANAGPWNAATAATLRHALRPGRLVIMHNAQFDLEKLHKAGIHPMGPVFDTMIAGAILEPDLPNNLEHVAKDYTDIEPWKHLAGEDMRLYGCIDADATYSIYEQALVEMEREGCKGVFETSMKVLPLLLEMYEKGLRIDHEEMRRRAADCLERERGAERDLLREVQRLPDRIRRAEELDQQMRSVWEKGEGAAPKERIALRKESRLLIERLHEEVLPNLNSQQQLLKVLDEMGVPRRVDHKTKRVTTDAAAIQELARQTGKPILKRLLDMRVAGKLRTTFYSQELDGDDRLHPQYLLHRDYDIEGGAEGACSGRLASKGPNIQNWPDEARSIVVADEDGWEVMDADYKQIEFRVIAYETGGKLWEDVNTPGFDIHRTVASRVYKCSPAKVTATQRDEGKRCVYAGAYGVGPLTLSRRLAAKGIFLSVAECKAFIGAFKAMYPEVAKTQQRWMQEAARTNKITNPFGRFRRFLKPSQENTEITNFFPQSTAGDIILRAMARLRGELPKEARIGIQVHDSLTLFYPREMREEVKECVRDVMTAKVGEMPGFLLEVDLKVGKNWGSLEGIS